MTQAVNKNFAAQRGYRTMMLWVAWAAAALAAYLSLYQDTKVWDFIKHDPSRVTWIILVLFLFGVLLSFAITWLVTQEYVKVTELESYAEHQGLTGISGNPTSRRVVERFFHALRTVVISGGARPDVSTLIEIEVAHFLRLSQMVELLGNILITMGLIGTVMGLTMTLTGLTGSLDALGQDQDELLRGLRSAMAGMGTAFYTTLLGAVFGGVLLRMFAQINENGVDSLQDAMLRICLVHCATDMEPSLERDLRLLDAQVQVLSNNVEQLHGVFAKTRNSMAEFQQQIQHMQAVAGNQEERQRLREFLQNHHEYAALLRHELDLQTMRYGSWWGKIKLYIARMIGWR
ncbi:MAG: MotA/TolQ/ExbB proton channel family protein [Pseudomonadota bacterium]